MYELLFVFYVHRGITRYGVRSRVGGCAAAPVGVNYSRGCNRSRPRPRRDIRWGIRWTIIRGAPASATRVAAVAAGIPTTAALRSAAGTTSALAAAVASM